MKFVAHAIGVGHRWYNDVFSYKMDDNRSMKQTKHNLNVCMKHALFADVTIFCQEDLTSTSCAVEEIGFLRKEPNPYHSKKHKQEPYFGVQQTGFSHTRRYSTIPQFKTNSFE